MIEDLRIVPLANATVGKCAVCNQAGICRHVDWDFHQFVCEDCERHDKMAELYLRAWVADRSPSLLPLAKHDGQRPDGQFYNSAVGE